MIRRRVAFPPSDNYLCSVPKALISTSIAAGKSNFINASTVCGVG